MLNTKLKVTSSGLHIGDKEDPPIAPPIRVEAAVRVEGSDDRFVRLHFKDEHGEPVRALIPRAELDSSRALRKLLLNKGYAPPRDPEQWKLIADHLASTRPRKQVLIVNRVGWHGGSFVVPGKEHQPDSGFIEFAAQSMTHASDFSHPKPRLDDR